MSLSKSILKDVAMAGADLSGALFKFVSLNSAGEFILPAASGNPVYGVVTEPATAGNPVTVDVLGIVKVEAGATVATGAVVQTNAAGEAITAVAGTTPVGIARKGGADGEIIEVLMTQPFNAAT